MTTSERMARIDHQFDISFGVFDGRMRDEQGTIAGQRGGHGGTGTGKNGTGGADASSSGGGSESGDGAGSESGKGGGDKGAGGKQGQGAGGASGTGGESGQGQGSGKGGRTGGGGGYGGGELGGNGPNTAPADIPDGRDDDVVARQLREAATAETDPELREKLWQEYRNYKKGS